MSETYSILFWAGHLSIYLSVCLSVRPGLDAIVAFFREVCHGNRISPSAGRVGRLAFFFLALGGGAVRFGYVSINVCVYFVYVRQTWSESLCSYLLPPSVAWMWCSIVDFAVIMCVRMYVRI